MKGNLFQYGYISRRRSCATHPATSKTPGTAGSLIMYSTVLKIWRKEAWFRVYSARNLAALCQESEFLCNLCDKTNTFNAQERYAVWLNIAHRLFIWNFCIYSWIYRIYYSNTFMLIKHEILCKFRQIYRVKKLYHS